MWQVYLAVGWHSFLEFTDEQFEDAKKFYRLFDKGDGTYTNKRGNIHAWRMKGGA